LEDRRPPLDALTSLRFVTALHVFIFHLEAARLVYAPEPFRRLASVGYVGVSWFFVLSGFILAYAYAGRPIVLGHFWRARWRRVYPAYFLALCIATPLFIYVLFYAPAMHDDASLAPMREHVTSFTLAAFVLVHAWIPAAALGVNPVGWSLSAEAFFYFLFPMLLPRMASLSRRTLVYWVLAMAFLSAATALAYVLRAPDGVSDVMFANNDLFWLNVLRFNPLVRLPEFLVGVCGGLLYVRFRAAERWAAPLVSAGLFALFAVVVFEESIPYPLIHNGLMSLPFLAIIYGVALRPWWSRFLEWRAFRRLGEVSYSFFLTHLLVIAVVLRPDGKYREIPFHEALVCLVVSIILGFVLYRWVEQPFRYRSVSGAGAPAMVTNGH